MTLEQQINLARTQAQHRAEMFYRERDNIRTDNTLSEHGKLDRLARAYVDAHLDMDTYQSHETTTAQARKRELERVLFGWEPTNDPSVLRSRRESNELADALRDPSEALDEYNAAKTRNDELHVRAIFARALASGWQRIISDYLSEHPERDADASELAAIQDLLSDAGKLNVSMTYYLAKPNELASVLLSQYEGELRATRSRTFAASAPGPDNAPRLSAEEAAVRTAFARQLRRV